MINRRKRRDGNHREVLDAFKVAGWRVIDTSQLGDAVPDAVVCKAGRWVAVEIKTPTGKLTAQQQSWHADWPGETAIIRSVSDVLELTRA